MIVFSLNNLLSRKIIFSSPFAYSNLRGYASANHYDVLGVKKNASQEEIKRAFYAKSKKLHPDKHSNDKRKHDQFVKVSSAYTILSSREGRWQYDTGMPYGVPKPVYYKMRTPGRTIPDDFNDQTFRYAFFYPIAFVIFFYILYFDILRTAPDFDDGDRFLKKVYEYNDEFVNMNKFYWSLDMKAHTSLALLSDKDFTEKVRSLYQSSDQYKKDMIKKEEDDERKRNYVSVYKIDPRPKNVRDAEAAQIASQNEKLELENNTKLL